MMREVRGSRHVHISIFFIAPIMSLWPMQHNHEEPQWHAEVSETSEASETSETSETSKASKTSDRHLHPTHHTTYREKPSSSRCTNQLAHCSTVLA